MKVCKFGGSSLATAEQVDKVCRIITADAERRLIVVSAPGKRTPDDTKVTDLLILAAEARLSGQSGAEELEEVLARYTEIATGLGLPTDAVDPIAENLSERLNGPIENNAAFRDAVKACGEDNSARLIARVLQHRGVDAHYVDPGEAGMLLSDEPGDARVLKQAYDRLQSLRDRPGINIFPGFFGYTESGRIVTFPRGGSDITGAILARAVRARRYENFTDVDSVFVAHPGLIDDPRALDILTYREMRELAYAGFSVFHDEALEPVFHAGIPVHILNTNNPKAAGTLIVPERKQDDHPVTGIAAMDHICSVYVSKYLMNREVGFGRRLLQIFEDERLSFEHAPSGIDNMSVLLKEPGFTPEVEERVVRRIRTELNADDVYVERGLGLIMIVGEGMRHSIGLAARACGAFARAGVNLEMINQGSTEVSMMFGVRAKDVPAAVRSLYQEFFGS